MLSNGFGEGTRYRDGVIRFGWQPTDDGEAVRVAANDAEYVLQVGGHVETPKIDKAIKGCGQMVRTLCTCKPNDVRTRPCEVPSVPGGRRVRSGRWAAQPFVRSFSGRRSIRGAFMVTCVVRTIARQPYRPAEDSSANEMAPSGPSGPISTFSG